MNEHEFQIQDTIGKIENQILKEHTNIVVAISGGSDSDVLIDLFSQHKNTHNIRFVFFNTGLESKYTHEHLRYIEDKYNVVIEKVRATKPIPLAVKEHGIPFKSKRYSENMQRLINHGFDFKNDGNKSFEELVEKYTTPKFKKDGSRSKKDNSCTSALQWWCQVNGETSRIKIGTKIKNKIIENPPKFEISNKCCYYAKKLPMENWIKENKDVTLVVLGERKAEGGVRATNAKCYAVNQKGLHKYNPLLNWSDDCKAYYNETREVTNSKLYTVWGLKRSGCMGCIYARNYKQELELVQKYEPEMFKAIQNVFGESYKYNEYLEE